MFLPGQAQRANTPRHRQGMAESNQASSPGSVHSRLCDPGQSRTSCQGYFLLSAIRGFVRLPEGWFRCETRLFFQIIMFHVFYICLGLFMGENREESCCVRKKLKYPLIDQTPPMLMMKVILRLTRMETMGNGDISSFSIK